MSEESVLTSPSGRRYVVTEKVVNAGVFSLYKCLDSDTDREVLLQASREPRHNVVLDRAAFILRMLKDKSDEQEEAYSKVREEGDPRFLSYDLCFPDLVETFVSNNGQRINILAFRNVDHVWDVKPFTLVVEKDHLRPDMRTSAWILGKFLKILSFLHSVGVSFDQLDGSNLAFVPEHHYVNIFSFTSAVIHPDGIVPIEHRRQDILRVVRAVIDLMDGDCDSREFPEDGEVGAERYLPCVLDLASGRWTKATEAHAEFYRIVEGLEAEGIWPRGFYPATYKPR